MKGLDVKKKLQAAGYSVSKIASDLGIIQQNLESKLRAKDVSSSTIEQICSVTHLPISFFYNENSHNQAPTTPQNSDNFRQCSTIFDPIDPRDLINPSTLDHTAHSALANRASIAIESPSYPLSDPQNQRIDTLTQEVLRLQRMVIDLQQQLLKKDNFTTAHLDTAAEDAVAYTPEPI